MNKKLIFSLVIGMVLLFVITSIWGWTSDTVIVDGLPVVDAGNTYYSPNAFWIGGELYLFYGQQAGNGAINGFKLGANGTWQNASSIIAGIQADGQYSHWTTFQIGSNIYGFFGCNNGTALGYAWSGSSWTRNITVESGLSDAGDGNKPTIFNIGSNIYMIIGSEGYNGYVWSGAGWNSNSTILTGLTEDDTYLAPQALRLGNDTLYMVTGATDGQFDGWRWDSGSWTPDFFINSSLGDVGGMGTPAVFNTSNTYEWYLISGDSNGNFEGFNLSTTPPYNLNVSIVSPANQTTYISGDGINLTVNHTSSAEGGETPFSLVNTTYVVWFSNGTTYNLTTQSLSGTTQTKTITYDGVPFNNYLWNAYGCMGNGADTNCSWATHNNTFSVSRYAINSVNHSSIAYETDIESYWINISSNSSLTDVYLHFNGTRYTGTSEGGGIYNYTSGVSSSRVGNNSIIWELIYAGASYNSSTYYQTISPILFGFCNATLTVPYVNFSFKDEADLSVINATIPSSEFVYWISNTTFNKTYTFTNNTENYYYAFCFTPPNKTLNIDMRIQYKWGTDYPQRVYDPPALSFTNSTTNKTLYLLESSDGIYVTFQIVNVADQTLSGVSVNATREISGVETLVGQGITGDDGTVTLWLNPDFIHTFMFEKSGYTTVTSSFAPTQTSYTIRIGETSVTAEQDYTKGVSIIINPSLTVLQNNTEYTFNMTLSSAYWDIENFGFVLINSTGEELGSASSTAGSGTVYYVLNTGNNTKIIMNYYYVVNGTYQNYSRTWIVFDESSGTGVGLKTFFTHLKNYLTTGDGLFGSNSFTVALLTFLFIFIFTGIMAYQFGITSPAAVMGLIFGLVLFFDVGVGLIPNVRNIHLVTILTALIMIGVLVREGIR